MIDGIFSPMKREYIEAKWRIGHEKKPVHCFSKGRLAGGQNPREQKHGMVPLGVRPVAVFKT
jgi:hypothetical protein